MLLPFAHPLCLGTLSFAEGNIEYPTDLKRSLVFFSVASYLLAYCLAEGASPITDGAGGGGGVATLIMGLARPNPRQQYGCNFHQGVPRQTVSLFLLKRQRTLLKKRKETRLRTVRRCQVILAKLSLALEKARKSVLREMSISHVSLRKLEKALKSVLREMPSCTFLLGNWKNSGWTVIGEWTATANRNLSLLLRCQWRTQKGGLGGSPPRKILDFQA